VQTALEVGHEVARGAWWSVSAIEQPMHDDIGGSAFACEPRNRDGMPIDRMDATGPDEPDQVQPMTLSRPTTRMKQSRVLEEPAIFDLCVDPRQILHHGPTRT